MKARIAMVVTAVAVVLAAVLVLWYRANNAPPPVSQPGERVVPERDESEAAIPTATRAPRERPRIDMPTHHVEPPDPPPRVDIDRRPYDPSRETESQYQRRATFVAAFDAFREESGISSEKEQLLLQLLYDYQENARHVRKQHLDRIPYADPWKEKYESRKTRHTGMLMRLDTLDALEELLSEDELRAWSRHMEHISMTVFAYLNWPYEPPLIMPTDPCGADAAGDC